MNKTKQKKIYSAPHCIIVHVNESTYLLDTSFPSQHRPAQRGGSLGDAKQALVWEETGDEDDNRLDAWKN